MAEAHRIRPARAADLGLIAAVEDTGDAQYLAWFGDATVPALVEPAPSGQQRAAKPGFLLVAVDPADESERPIGFAHVLDLEGHGHLEQLSVVPDHQGRGIGASLVRAAMAEASDRGYDRLTLCTYRDVPWNGPFYRRLGFAEVAEADLEPYQARLRETERSLGLDVNGVRTVMSVSLG